MYVNVSYQELCAMADTYFKRTRIGISHHATMSQGDTMMCDRIRADQCRRASPSAIKDAGTGARKNIGETDEVMVARPRFEAYKQSPLERTSGGSMPYLRLQRRLVPQKLRNAISTCIRVYGIPSGRQRGMKAGSTFRMRRNQLMAYKT